MLIDSIFYISKWTDFSIDCTRDSRTIRRQFQKIFWKKISIGSYNMICRKIDLQPSLEVLFDLNFEDLAIHLYELVKCKMRFRFLEHMEDQAFDLWNPNIWRLRKVDGPGWKECSCWSHAGPSTFIYFHLCILVCVGILFMDRPLLLLRPLMEFWTSHFPATRKSSHLIWTI